MAFVRFWGQKQIWGQQPLTPMATCLGQWENGKWCYLMVEWVDRDIQCWVVPLHLLSLLHVHLHRALLGRPDASDTKDDQENKESNADDSNHCNSRACDIHMWAVSGTQLSINKFFIDVVQNRPLWRMMSTFGTMHSQWCKGACQKRMNEWMS